MPDDDGDDGLPELPYGHGEQATSGHSGTDTSEARAREADASGETARRQRAVLALLARRKGHGATWREVSQHVGVHHGSASGTLSNLHRAGRIARLAEVRDRCHVYVLNEDVGGRATEPYGKAPDVVKQAWDRDVKRYLEAQAMYGDVRARGLLARLESNRGWT
jgi:hypothetical protein